MCPSGPEGGGQPSGGGVRLLFAGRTPREDRELQAGAAGSVPRARRTPEDGQTEEAHPAGARGHQLQPVRTHTHTPLMLCLCPDRYGKHSHYENKSIHTVIVILFCFVFYDFKIDFFLLNIFSQ